MKTKTKVERITQLTQLIELRKHKEKAKNDLLGQIDLNPHNAEAVHGSLAKYTEILNKWNSLNNEWKKRDSKSRAWAESQVSTIEEFVNRRIKVQDALRRSGDVTFAVEWTSGEYAYAETVTSDGEQYSRRCKFRKTNAHHLVRLSPDWAADWTQSVADISRKEGIILIGQKLCGKACWLEIKRRRLRVRLGWFVTQNEMGYHSTRSINHARAGLAKKISAHQRAVESMRIESEWAKKPAEERRRDERRARLLARKCNLSATINDARELGFCSVGIKNFQERFNIGNSASLPELVRTGDPSACRLAFHIARKAIVAARATIAKAMQNQA